MTNIYSPLDAQRQQFRVLTLLPGAFDDPIEGALKIVSVDQPSNFGALSYVWGTDFAAKPAIINGQQTTILANLDSAIRHIRPTNNDVELWTDAICINQTDFEEKATQVKLMGDIYSLAGNVLIWLGSGNPKIDEIMQSIGELNEELWNTYEFAERFMDILYIPWFTRIWVVQEFVLGKREPMICCGKTWVWWSSFKKAWFQFESEVWRFHDARAAVTLSALKQTFDTSWMKKHYWEALEDSVRPGQLRVKLQQLANVDSISARDTILTLTELAEGFNSEFLAELGFSTLDAFAENIRENPHAWKKRHSIIQHQLRGSPQATALHRRLSLFSRNYVGYPDFLDGARDQCVGRGERLDIVHAITETATLEATDPRDKIYGLLGLIDKDICKSFPLSYLDSPEQAYLSAMSFMLREGLVRPSLRAWLWMGQQGDLRLPSWVPNFRGPYEWLGPYATHHLLGSCANFGWDFFKDYQVLEDDCLLNAKGLSYGSIKDVVHCSDDTKHPVVSHLKDIDELARQNCDNSEPLWFTLISSHEKSTLSRPSDADSLSRWFSKTGESPYDPSQYDREYRSLLRLSIADSDGMSLTWKEIHLLKHMSMMLTNRVFFVTDTGFAGVATPDVCRGDTVAVVAGMSWATILRPVSPMVPVEGSMRTAANSRERHQIVGFAYIGCKQRVEFEKTWPKPEEWAKHVCFVGQDLMDYYIV